MRLENSTNNSLTFAAIFSSVIIARAREQTETQS
jgi:malic enzyme